MAEWQCKWKSDCSAEEILQKNEQIWEVNMKNIIKRYSDGAYYFKDTSVKEPNFETMDDTIENPFEQLDLSIT